MGKLILVAATAFMVGSPTCDRFRESGNRFKSLAAHFLSMPEPSTTLIKPKPEEKSFKGLPRIKKPEHIFDLVETYENGNTLWKSKGDYVLLKDKDKKVIREGRLVKELPMGKIVKDADGKIFSIDENGRLGLGVMETPSKIDGRWDGVNIR